jgi:hypothetical protein
MWYYVLMGLPLYVVQDYPGYRLPLATGQRAVERPGVPVAVYNKAFHYIILLNSVFHIQ